MLWRLSGDLEGLSGYSQQTLSGSSEEALRKLSGTSQEAIQSHTGGSEKKHARAAPTLKEDPGGLEHKKKHSCQRKCKS